VIVYLSKTRFANPDKTAMALEFEFYDVEVADHLKYLLKVYGGRARLKGYRSAGGWLPPMRIWFVWEVVWPDIAYDLRDRFGHLEFRQKTGVVLQ